MLKRLARPEAEPPWSFYGAIMAMAGLFIAVVIGATIAQIVLGDSPSTPVAGWTIGAVLATVFVLVSRRSSAAEMSAMRIDPADTPRRLPILILLCIGLAVTFDLAGQIVTGDFWPAPELLGFFDLTAQNELLYRDVSIAGWVIAFVFLVLMQPLAEELVFRGVTFPSLRSAFGPWTGLVLCAGFYAAFHLLAYPPPRPDDFTQLWYGLLLPFLDGLVFSSVRAYTGSTRAAIVAHAAFGLFAVLKAITLTG
jgi:membrane protease YdiL (CAAX protease family)